MMERISIFIMPMLILFTAPSVSPSLLPAVWATEALVSLIPSINLVLVIIKAAYRGWVAVNNPYIKSDSVLNINGCLIEMSAMALVIVLCPILTYFNETKNVRSTNDGSLAKIFASEKLRG